MRGPAKIVQRHFENVTDPRVDRGANHNLLEKVFIALTAALCGANGWADVERFAKAKLDWFGKYIALPHGVPSHDTFGRVFSRLDTGEFLSAMHQWIDQFAGCLRDRGIAAGGKTLRGSFDQAAGRSPLHTITAFATDTRLVLRQMSVDEDSNEIPAVPVLLQLLELTGAVVTLDAMHCQRQTARTIVERGADYAPAVKSNQGNLHARLNELFEQYAEVDYEVEGLRKQISAPKRSYGRTEQRACYVIAAPQDDSVFARWPALRSIGMLYRHSTTRDQQGELKETQTVTFFLSSLPPRVRRLNQLLRDHWAIENSQHYVLDVIFTEDASRIRTGSAPEAAAALRRLSLNILQQDTTLKDSICGKRLRAGWDEAVLDRIYAAFQAV